MADKERILVIDDEEAIRDSLKVTLDYEGYDTRVASTAREGLAAIESERPGVVLLDVKMPIMDGMELLRELRTRGHQAPIILISGHATASTAFEAARLGAFAVLEKPFETEQLLLNVRNALQRRQLEVENADLKRRIDRRYEIVSDSSEFSHVLTLIQKAGPTSATVLITGESGTGKELVARAIHRASPRAGKAFVQVNCAAIPEELIESELFGHEKGSFTGAVDKQVGKFVMADQGTIFLDEIGDMSAKTQAKVLRVLQEGDVEPVGAAKTVKVDVRVVAATNKDLEKEIKEGNFREDLYYRLNVIPIHVPPLRQRRQDILPLVQHFTRQFCQDNNFKLKTYEPEALKALMEHGWPGNVRELKNAIERVVILSAGEKIELDDLPEGMTERGTTTGTDFSHIPTLKEFKEVSERAYLVGKLRANGWNISQTAQSIDTPRSNLYKKLEQHAISQETDG